MTTAQDLFRAITDPDMKRIAREAIAGGWEFVGFTGTTHAMICWPPTGDRLTFGCTPSVGSWKTAATDITRISGVEVWRKGNKKRSRKADQVTDFSLETVTKEQSTWSRQWGDRVDQLLKEHGDLVNQFRKLKEEGTRTAAQEALIVIRKLANVEGKLQEFHQHYSPFDPMD